MLNTVSLHDTLEPFTLGHSEHVDHLVLVEHRVDLHFFLKVVIGEVHLLLGRTSVDLDLEHVVLLLSQLGESLHLSADNGAHHGTVLSDSVQGHIDGFLFLFVFLGIFGEGFFLGVHPVLVESSHGVSVEFLGPDSG